MKIAAFGNQQQQQTFDIMKITVQTNSGADTEITALVVPTITAPICNCATSETLQMPHLIGLTMAQTASTHPLHVSVLIDAHFCWSFVGDCVVRGKGPTTVESSLGYLLSGPISSGTTFPTEVTAFHVLADTAQPSHEKFWELESIGIMDKQTDDSRQDFTTFRNQYIEKRENHYVAKLPWKSDNPPMPTNHQISQTRTQKLVQKLPKDTLQVYDRIIKEQEARGFIERVENDHEMAGHYLPHHAVKKDSVTTPIRVVFDCSCSSAGGNSSFNDCLQNGPALINDLVAILNDAEWEIPQWLVFSVCDESKYERLLRDGDTPMLQKVTHMYHAAEDSRSQIEGLKGATGGTKQVNIVNTQKKYQIQSWTRSRSQQPQAQGPKPEQAELRSGTKELWLL